MSLNFRKGLINIIKKSLVIPFRLKSTSQFEVAYLKEYGKPLVLEKCSRRPLEPNQVRVDVKFCSLNYNDVRYLEKRDEKGKTLPYVPGYELSGEITEAGCNCELEEGDRVVGLIRSGHGGLSQEAVLDVDDVWRLHPEIPYKDAAALVSAHSTALLAFTHCHTLQENSTILVIAGAGGYGLAAVDVASSIFKAKVIALSDAACKATLMRDRGAFASLQNDLKRNYKEIMKVTNGDGVDLIYDAVGGPILNTVAKCFKDPQKAVLLGTYQLRNKIIQKSEDEDPKEKSSEESREEENMFVPLEEVKEKFQRVSIFKFRNQDKEAYRELVQQTLDYYEDEVLAPHISRVFSLADVNQAIDFIKGKHCTGKVLIEINKD